MAELPVSSVGGGVGTKVGWYWGLQSNNIGDALVLNRHFYSNTVIFQQSFSPRIGSLDQ